MTKVLTFKKPQLIFSLIMLLTVVSCSNEEIDDFSLKNSNSKEQATEKLLVRCNYDMSSIAANTTISLDCDLNLNGKTYQLPANTNIEYAGGSLTNGTLVFRGGTIDGKLMNSELHLRGNIKLKDPVFVFDGSKWANIKQGNVSSEVALQNTAEFENLIFRLKRLGATAMEMDQFDAYFETTKVTSTTTNQNFYASVEAINLPSGFHLKMSDNTHFRQYPAEEGIENGAIMAVRDVSNVKVSGGNFHGDRNQRGYSANDVGLEGTHLFYIHSGRNITIDGVNFIEGSKGGVVVNSLGFTFEPDYRQTTDVKIQNCNFINVRRMGVVITDGRRIYVENNSFTNIGQPMSGSDGGEVGYAINIEPLRTRDNSGNMVEYEKAEDIVIKGNTEVNSRVGFAALTIGQNITVEQNTIETRMTLSLTSGTKVVNNTFIANPNNPSVFAIFAAGGHSETVYGNEIYDNTIEGYEIGIALDTKDVNVSYNTIENCETGIQIRKTINAKINNNNIKVNGTGINASNTFADNVLIKDNSIWSQKFHAYLNQLNKNDQYASNEVLLDGNEFLNDKKISIYNTQGVTLNNNSVEGGIEIGNAKSITVQTNREIKPVNSDGIRLYGTHEDVFISSNEINEPSGASRYQCIKNNSTTPNGVNISGNTCI